MIWSTPEDLAIKPEQGWQSWVTGCALSIEPVAGFRIRSIKAAGGSRDVSRAPRGPRRILILSDREGGEIRAIMDEDWCHAVRTAAAATVAMRLLARKNAAILAMLDEDETCRKIARLLEQAYPHSGGGSTADWDVCLLASTAALAAVRDRIASRDGDQ